MGIGMAGMEHFGKNLGKSHITADSLCSLAAI